MKKLNNVKHIGIYAPANKPGYVIEDKVAVVDAFGKIHHYC